VVEELFIIADIPMKQQQGVNPPMLLGRVFQIETKL
jgi:hypothetical protein